MTNGKGSAKRPYNRELYDSNYDAIFRKKSPPQKDEVECEVEIDRDNSDRSEKPIHKSGSRLDDTKDLS